MISKFSSAKKKRSDTSMDNYIEYLNRKLDQRNMGYSYALVDFQKHSQRYYICYSFASMGLQSIMHELMTCDPDPDRNMLVGPGHPKDGNFNASINIGELLKSSQAGGDFHNQIAKSFICAIYSLWDEYYRHKIASENSVGQKNVASDLMGDVRHMRNCIIHKKSEITNEHEKLQELRWALSPGELVVTGDMFRVLITQINEMTVRIQR
jgi:hypothetical protein